MSDVYEDEFSQRETDRQDFVDNSIQDLLEELSFTDGSEMEWDIENISIVRDAVQEVLVDTLQVMSEQEFYPYRELEGYEAYVEQNKIEVPVDDLHEAIVDALLEIDLDDLASIGAQLLGGTCYYSCELEKFVFVPNHNYMGAFDRLQGIDRDDNNQITA